jgi:type II secretory pathway predicted ATPase ExeA
MYERFFRLRERPFALTPDPDYLYLSAGHRDALDHLRLGLESDAGFIALTGEIGCGKTTLLQALVTSLDGRTVVARLVDTNLTPEELLESLLLDFGIDDIPPSKPAKVSALARLLVDQRSLGRRVLIVIDEAQNLPRRTLEELRMLSNLETEKSKLVQIVLAGQPSFRDSLASPALEQLRQRVSVRYHLEPLDAEDTAGYINHRLRIAAVDAPLQLSRSCTDVIHHRSRGVPRLINVIADAVLLAAYGEDQRGISQTLVTHVCDELERASILAPRSGPVLATAPPPLPMDRLAGTGRNERVAPWPAPATVPTPAPVKDGPR